LGPGKDEILRFPQKTVAKTAKGASNIDINASSQPGDPAMSEDELSVAVQRIIAYGVYEECKHSSQDRSYRNISDDDIQFCLSRRFKLTGVEPGEDSRGRKCWKYRVTGRDTEGAELSLVITVNTETQKLKIITKF
jgi:hypothetical protein